MAKIDSTTEPAESTCLDEDVSVAGCGERGISANVGVNGDRGRTVGLDRRALAAIYEQYASDLSLSLRRMFGNGPPDPDDVMQQAFQKLIERDREEQVHNYKAFLWRTAKNIVISEKRSQTVRRRYEPDVETKFFAGGGVILDPQRVLIAKDQLQHINEALREMPAKRRRAFMLNRIEGLNVSEVGRRLGLSRSGAHKHILKALAQLDEVIEENTAVDRNEQRRKK